MRIVPRRVESEERMSHLGDAWTALLDALDAEPDEAAARRHARWMAERLAVWPPTPGTEREVPTWRSLHVHPRQAEINERGKRAALAMLRSRQTDNEGEATS